MKKDEILIKRLRYMYNANFELQVSLNTLF